MYSLRLINPGSRWSSNRELQTEKISKSGRWPAGFGAASRYYSQCHLGELTGHDSQTLNLIVCTFAADFDILHTYSLHSNPNLDLSHFLSRRESLQVQCRSPAVGRDTFYSFETDVSVRLPDSICEHNGLPGSTISALGRKGARVVLESRKLSCMRTSIVCLEEVAC
ncbi:hypothetical protein Mp_1g18710 [Marchantia polymorpha subsp. ruderalis]|uniref:Uncharacterized protein n=2 Tax=Marchantia polymorpha TaxID=3197 RepID=A0AAF6ARN1_MARPO|nr:hypothetical protein MARPO_0001s0209 [Marchantia polymorpha]BBM99101.1 hypothetical protein Mp_1g18710 [Marchantia polymorpha subsp. ruderalis]|eukprot:PTQ50178.1 hypothetical protein MARPO_0001s0209 [Marchantia polymorpha]